MIVGIGQAPRRAIGDHDPPRTLSDFALWQRDRPGLWDTDQLRAFLQDRDELGQRVADYLIVGWPEPELWRRRRERAVAAVLSKPGGLA